MNQPPNQNSNTRHTTATHCTFSFSRMWPHGAWAWPMGGTSWLLVGLRAHWVTLTEMRSANYTIQASDAIKSPYTYSCKCLARRVETMLKNQEGMIDFCATQNTHEFHMQPSQKLFHLSYGPDPASHDTEGPKSRLASTSRTLRDLLGLLPHRSMCTLSRPVLSYLPRALSLPTHSP